MKNIHEKIYLQIGEDCDADDIRKLSESEITWAQEKIFANDIEYRLNQWQPIETAPKDGSLILILEKYGRIQIAKWIANSPSPDWYCQLTQIFDNAYPTTNVTHWMPLPEPPEKK